MDMRNAPLETSFDNFFDYEDDDLNILEEEGSAETVSTESLSIDTKLQHFEDRTNKIVDIKVRNLMAQKVRYDRHRLLEKSYHIEGYFDSKHR